MKICKNGRGTMKEFKLITILCLFLIFFVGAGYVSAADNGNNITVSDMVYIENTTISDEISFEEPPINGNTGNFENLKNEIDQLNPGDTLNLKKDYIYKINDNYDHGDNSAIKILTDNITINGNGHVISANNKAVIFNVLGNNVKIQNVTFINAKFDRGIVNSNNIPEEETCFGNPQRDSYYNPYIVTPYKNRIHEITDESGESAVRWFGNNGVLSDCNFIGNAAMNGGALSWRGNNGLITNCGFLNNNARVVGGAIIISGANNTISKSIFKNSHSKYTNDAIFVDLNYENCTITDCLFDAPNPIIDAKKYNVSGDYLKRGFTDTIGEKNIDLIPLIHKATVNNSTIKYNKDISYSISWNNANCIFNITSKIQNGLIECTYHFNNVNGLNDVIKKLLAKNYAKNSFITVTVNNADEYKDIINYKSEKGHNILNITANIPLSVYKLYSTFNMFDEIYLNNIGTFNDLAGEINNLHPGDTLNLTKNYYFNENNDKHDIIINTDNITINGNGYVIDGMQKHAVFNVSGNNIKICNLTFINANNSQVNDSMISWNGDNGVLSKCNLWKNIAVNGGAVNWKGNNGLMNQCSFINNAANVGGAVYVSGLNNRICKSTFENCYSKLVYEAIFVECGIENCNISSCSFNNVIPVFDKLLNCNIEDNASTLDELDSLVNNLHPGDVINITKDYYYSGSGENIIRITADNVTVNGNGHIINGMNHYLIFNVTGNNVKIYNLTFINAKNTDIKVIRSSKWENITYNNGSSVISWYGDEGVLSDCNLFENTAVNGGALTWMGNKGLINNCIFINNTASGVGGAIYIAGVNNTISNAVFRDSSSKLTCEAIFIGCGYENLNISRCMNNNKIFVIDGNLSSIDVEYLHYSVYHNIAGENIDLIPTIYKAIMYNSALNYTENISYGFVYDKNTFLLLINGKLNNGEYFINKEYYFENVTYYNNVYAWNKIFKDILGGTFGLNLSNAVTAKKTYKTTQSIIKNVYVKNSDDYIKVCHLKKSADYDYLSKRGFDIRDASLSLNVTFEDNLSIAATETWKIHDRGYTVIYVNGHGSKIYLPKNSKAKIWATIDEKDFFSASNLIIDGFNCNIEINAGTCMFNGVSFKNAHNNGDFNRGFGGGILNQGFCYCENCYFYNNSAKYGGAVFNVGNFTFRHCIFENNHASKKGPDICEVDNGVHTYKDDDYYWRLSSADGFEWPVPYGEQYKVINGELIKNTGKCGYTYLKSDSLVKKSIMASALSFVVGTVTGLVVGIATLNPAAGFVAGVAAGVATGIGGGAYIAWYVGEHNYDPDYQAWKTYTIIIGLSVVSGAMGGITGGYIGAGVAAYVNSEINILAAEIMSDAASVVSTDQCHVDTYLFTVF